MDTTNINSIGELSIPTWGAPKNAIPTLYQTATSAYVRTRTDAQEKYLFDDFFVLTTIPTFDLKRVKAVLAQIEFMSPMIANEVMPTALCLVDQDPLLLKCTKFVKTHVIDQCMDMVSILDDEEPLDLRRIRKMVDLNVQHFEKYLTYHFDKSVIYERYARVYVNLAVLKVLRKYQLNDSRFLFDETGKIDVPISILLSYLRPMPIIIKPRYWNVEHTDFSNDQYKKLIEMYAISLYVTISSVPYGLQHFVRFDRILTSKLVWRRGEEKFWISIGDPDDAEDWMPERHPRRQSDTESHATATSTSRSVSWQEMDDIVVEDAVELAQNQAGEDVEHLPGGFVNIPNRNQERPSFFSTASSLYAFAQSIAMSVRDKEPSQVLNELLDGYALHVGGAVGQKVGQAKDTIKDLVSEMLMFFRRNWKTVLSCVSAVMLYIAWKFDIGWMKYLAIFMMLVLAFLGVRTLVKNVIELAEMIDQPDVDIADLFAPEFGDVENQARGDSILVALLAFFGVAKSTPTTQLVSILARNTKRTADDLTWLVSLIKDTFFWLTAHMSKWIDIPSYLLDEKGNEEWIKRVDDLIARHAGGTIPVSGITLGILYETYVDGLNIANELRKSKKDATASETLNHCRELAKIIRELKKTLNKGCKKRAAPLGILLYGLPGTGKSNLMQLISSCAMVWMLREVLGDEKALEEYMESPERFVYHKNCEKWWPGIRDSHQIVEHDELFQVRGIPGTEVSDAFEVMQIVNESPWIPAMAAADEKGMVHPTPFLYIATTNSPMIADESVEDKTAVARRLLPIQVTNKGPLAKDLGKSFDSDIYVLTVGRWKGNTMDFSCGRQITIPQLLQHIAAHYAKSQQFFKSSKDRFGDVMEEMMDVMKKATVDDDILAGPVPEEHTAIFNQMADEHQGRRYDPDGDDTGEFERPDVFEDARDHFERHTRARKNQLEIPNLVDHFEKNAEPDPNPGEHFPDGSTDYNPEEDPRYEINEDNPIDYFWRDHPWFRKFLEISGIHVPLSSREMADLTLANQAMTFETTDNARYFFPVDADYNGEMLGASMTMSTMFVAYTNWRKTKTIGLRNNMTVKVTTPAGPAKYVLYAEAGITMWRLWKYQIPLPYVDEGVLFQSPGHSEGMTVGDLIRGLLYQRTGYVPGFMETVKFAAGYLDDAFKNVNYILRDEYETVRDAILRAPIFHQTIDVRTVLQSIRDIVENCVNFAYRVMVGVVSAFRRSPLYFTAASTAVLMLVMKFFPFGKASKKVGLTPVSKMATTVATKTAKGAKALFQRLKKKRSAKGKIRVKNQSDDVTFVPFKTEDNRLVVKVISDEEEFWAEIMDYDESSQYIGIIVEANGDDKITTEFSLNMILPATGFLKSVHAFTDADLEVSDQAASRTATEIVPVFQKNMWKFGASIEGSDSVNVLGYTLCLQKRIFIAPAHFFRAMIERAEGNPYQLCLKPGAAKEANWMAFGEPDIFVIKDFSTSQNRDLILFEITNNAVPEGKDLLPHIVDRSFVNTWSYDTLSRFKGCLAGALGETVEVFPGVRYTARVDIADANPSFTCKLASYGIYTRKGECGKLLITDDGTMSGKIFGIHTQGRDSMYQPRGYASYFDKDDILDALALYGVKLAGPVYSEAAASEVVETAKYYDKCIAVNKEINERLPYDPLVHNMITETRQLTPKSTTIAKVDIISFEPALVLKEPTTLPSRVGPKYYGPARAKYGENKYVIDSRMLEASARAYLDDLRKVPTNISPRPYSMEMAVNGIPGTAFKAIPIGTSAGYPWVPHGMSKKDMWSYEVDGSLTKGPCWGLLEEQVKGLLESWAVGEVPNVVFQDTLKVERRDKQKVLDGKTRMISGAPVHFTVACRMLFGPAMKFFQENSIACGTALGLNPYSDWNQLYHELDRFGPGKRCGAGDYSGFDTGHTPQLIIAAGDVLINLMKAEPGIQRMQRALIKHIAYSVHVRGNVGEKWVSSMPSGNPLTSIINCIINQIRFRLCWLDLHDDDTLCLPKFCDHVVLVVLGDDNIFTVSSAYMTKFTEDFVAMSQKRFGAVYTAEDKVSNRVGLRDITECTLLKRGFRFEPYCQEFLAVKNLQDILETMLWTKKQAPYEIAKQNAVGCVRELSLLGREVFDEWVPKINEIFDDWSVPCTQWSLVLDETRTSDYLKRDF